jgi:hypothetical protein
MRPGSGKAVGFTLQGDVPALVCLSLQGPSFVAGNWIGTGTFLGAYDKVPLRAGLRNLEKVAKLACSNYPINTGAQMVIQGRGTGERALSVS